MQTLQSLNISLALMQGSVFDVHEQFSAQGLPTAVWWDAIKLHLTDVEKKTAERFKLHVTDGVPDISFWDMSFAMTPDRYREWTWFLNNTGVFNEHEEVIWLSLRVALQHIVVLVEESAVPIFGRGNKMPDCLYRLRNGTVDPEPLRELASQVYNLLGSSYGVTLCTTLRDFGHVVGWPIPLLGVFDKILKLPCPVLGEVKGICPYGAHPEAQDYSRN